MGKLCFVADSHKYQNVFFFFLFFTGKCFSIATATCKSKLQDKEGLCWKSHKLSSNSSPICSASTWEEVYLLLNSTGVIPFKKKEKKKRKSKNDVHLCYCPVVIVFFPPFLPSLYSKELDKEQSHECSNTGHIYIYIHVCVCVCVCVCIYIFPHKIL